MNGLRPITFADHHADVSRLALPPVGAPLVERLYERALHCFLYAWFDYELTLLAESQAFSGRLCAEAADRQREDREPRPSPEICRGGGLRDPSASQACGGSRRLARNTPAPGGASQRCRARERPHEFTQAAIVFDHLRAIICELNGVPPPPGPTSGLLMPPMMNGGADFVVRRRAASSLQPLP